MTLSDEYPLQHAANQLEIRSSSSNTFSALQVIFWFEKQENVLIRALICGPKN